MRPLTFRNCLLAFLHLKTLFSKSYFSSGASLLFKRTSEILDIIAQAGARPSGMQAIPSLTPNVRQFFRIYFNMKTVIQPRNNHVK